MEAAIVFVCIIGFIFEVIPNFIESLQQDAKQREEGRKKK